MPGQPPRDPPGFVLQALLAGDLLEDEFDRSEDPHLAQVCDAVRQRVDPSARLEESPVMPVHEAYVNAAALIHELRSGGVPESLEDFAQARARVAEQLGIIATAVGVEEDEACRQIAGHLVLLGYRCGIDMDDDVIRDAVSLTMAGDMYWPTLAVLIDISESASLWATPKSSVAWLRLRYQLLVMWSDSDNEDDDVLDERLTVLSRFADHLGPGESAMPGVRWLEDETRATLAAIDEHSRSSVETHDDWLGTLLAVCDVLMVHGQVHTVRDLLSWGLDVVSRCAGGGYRSLVPGQPSRFREDCAFLLEMLA